eukprot:10775-Heterococcus_DN1.PRE.2
MCANIECQQRLCFFTVHHREDRLTICVFFTQQSTRFFKWQQQAPSSEFSKGSLCAHLVADSEAQY